MVNPSKVFWIPFQEDVFPQLEKKSQTKGHSRYQWDINILKKKTGNVWSPISSFSADEILLAYSHIYYSVERWLFNLKKRDSI